MQLLDAAWDLGYEQRSNVVEVYVRYLREKVDRLVWRRVAGDGARARLPAAQGRRPVSRLPIRVRLTIAFAAATTLVLIAAAAFVYLQLRADLDESIDATLQARATAVATSGAASASPATTRRASSRSSRRTGASWTAPAGLRARCGAASGERRVPGIDGTARVVVQRDGDAVVVVGQSLEDRDEVLDGLIAAFAIGGPLAVLVASPLGYALAGAGLRPVEAMRRRAAAGDRQLPLPEAHDEIRRLGETLNDMLARLRGSLERERQFVADASHELRTPLAVLKTELEAALRAGDAGLEARASISTRNRGGRPARPARRGPARDRPDRRRPAPRASRVHCRTAAARGGPRSLRRAGSATAARSMSRTAT